MALPVAVDPVNEILATWGLVLISSPTSCPRPSRMLKAPGGRSASCSACASTCACSGLSSLGLMTEAQPADSAEASLQQIVPTALFHGAISAATPTGRIATTAEPTWRVSGKSSSTCAALAKHSEA